MRNQTTPALYIYNPEQYHFCEEAVQISNIKTKKLKKNQAHSYTRCLPAQVTSKYT